MADNVVIPARPFDRWDLVAFRAYGDAFNIVDLIDENPHVPISQDQLTITAGTPINVPVISEPEVDSSNLPPWKR